MEPRPEPSTPNKKPNPFNSYLRYSGLAIQMLATIGVLGWLGYQADRYWNHKYPLLMLLLGFIGFAGSLYQVYRSITRE